MRTEMTPWPEDIRAYTLKLAFPPAAEDEA